jgi:ATPase subunit of ABC transporter with duplicated ATPase domains
MEPVLRDISVEFHPGWTGIIGDNGAGKTILLMIAAGLLEVPGGKISGPHRGGAECSALYCPQRTDELPVFWEDFCADREAGRLISRLEIKADWPWRWETLSCGERKRLHLGIALWRRPRILALDEPANHLDRETKALAAALESYTGIGLLVSHDRIFLDRLCTRCLFIRQGKGVLRPEGVSQGLAEEEREALEGRRIRKRLFDERDRLAAEAVERWRTAESSKKRLSKKCLDPKDSSGRGKINLARLSGKDHTGADLYKRMENRVSRLEADIEAAPVFARPKEGVTMETSRAKMDRLCTVPAGKIPLGENRFLSFPSLVICPQDRIALTGPNGAGKSTLIRFLQERLPPSLPTLYLPQEISAGESAAILEELRGESEKKLGEILARFFRLGSDPKTLLQSRLTCREWKISRDGFVSFD